MMLLLGGDSSANTPIAISIYVFPPNALMLVVGLDFFKVVLGASKLYFIGGVMVCLLPLQSRLYSASIPRADVLHRTAKP